MVGPAQKSTLVVVAHPDDEVLGAGGLISTLTSQGLPVRAAILCSGADARLHRPDDNKLLDDLRSASEALGMGEPILGDFPNIRMNMVPHLEIVQFIEAAMVETSAAHLVTHHPSDLNDDHRQVSIACQAAARLPQRRPELTAVSGLYFMEVPSSTDWSFVAPGVSFAPNSFVELTDHHLNQKINALACFRGVMREYPHPRSEEVLRGLAAVRGGQAGLNQAEAFQAAHLNLADVRWA
jgi:LmbE family N-acetylglucosaminyl deacetylase